MNKIAGVRKEKTMEEMSVYEFEMFTRKISRAKPKNNNK